MSHRALATLFFQILKRTASLSRISTRIFCRQHWRKQWYPGALRLLPDTYLMTSIWKTIAFKRNQGPDLHPEVNLVAPGPLEAQQHVGGAHLVLRGVDGHMSILSFAWINGGGCGNACEFESHAQGTWAGL